ncbi:MAG: GNAT family N-acetyltransferase [Almyronema sp.]
MAFQYRSLTDSQSVGQLKSLIMQCFMEPAGAIELYMQRVGVQNFRTIYQQNTLLGGLAQIPMGQWFGGQRVSMTGIAAVAIAPEYRGRGAAIALMQHTLQDLFEQGVALSVLYPAVQKLYCQVGYGQGGSYCGWQIASDSIHITQSALPIAEIALTDAGLPTLYKQQAPRYNGHLDRVAYLWQRLQPETSDRPVYAYRFGAADHPQGYLIFEQKRLAQATCLDVKDWAVLTPAATQTFWAFLAAHRSQIQTIHWQSGAIDPLTLTLPEQTAKPRFMSRWLVRIINLTQALTQRGYPVNLTVELHLEITDDDLTANSGCYVLAVAQGQGQVQPGGTGKVKLTIQALASLYTGLFSATQLYNAGRLESDEASRAIADQIFATTSPWLPDFF